MSLVRSARRADARACAALPAPAQPTIPTRTVTLVVPYPPGGGVDAMARVVAERLSAALGQQVVVDNRGGGSGLIGTRAVVKAAPDGYTLLLGHTGSISINPSLYANAGYDPRKDFAPIGLIASMPVVLIAHPSFPAKTIGDFVALAKKEPGKLNLGTSAVGTGGYMSAELFKAAAGIDVAIIPYKGRRRCNSTREIWQFSAGCLESVRSARRRGGARGAQPVAPRFTPRCPACLRPGQRDPILSPAPRGLVPYRRAQRVVVLALRQGTGICLARSGSGSTNHRADHVRGDAALLDRDRGGH